jgi:hypothetical protein
MLHVLQLVFHIASGVAGVFCLLTACLAYPGEEGQMQSVLEDLWTKIDDRQKGVLGAHTAFMQQVARAASRGFDQVFGHKLLSLRCLGVSVAYSIASFGLFAFLDNAENLLSGRMPIRESWSLFGSGLLEGGGLAALYMFLGSIPLIFKRFRFTKTWLLLILMTVPLLWEAGSDDPSWALKKMTIDFLSLGLPAVAGAFACDLFFIAVTRKLLRWAGEMKQSYKIAAVILLNILLGAGLVVAPFLGSMGYLAGDMLSFIAITTPQDRIAAAVLFVAGSNTLDFMASCVFVALALALLIHRALWPLLNRSVFRLQEIGTRGRRALLVSLGAALLGIALGNNAAEWARKAAELFTG